MSSPKPPTIEILKLQARAARCAEQRKWGEAASALLELTQRQPDDVEFWLRAAVCQRYAGDYDAATKTLQNALLHLNETKDRTSSTRCLPPRENEIEELHFALCETLAEIQNWAACETASRDLIARAPRHLAAREILATCLLQQGRIAEAETQVRALLQISPRDPLYRLKLATLLQLSGKSGESLQEFERVVANFPDAPFAAEAREAIDLLDNLQIQQVVMRLNEQPQFEQQLRADMTETLRDNGFQLTDEGRESLRHMMSDGRPEAAPPKMYLH